MLLAWSLRHACCTALCSVTVATIFVCVDCYSAHGNPPPSPPSQPARPLVCTPEPRSSLGSPQTSPITTVRHLPSPEGRSVDRREGRHGPAATYRSNRWLLHLSTDLYAAPAGGVDAGGASSSSVGGSSGGSSGVGGGGGGDLGFNAVFAAMSPRRPPKTIMVLRASKRTSRVSGQSRRRVVSMARDGERLTQTTACH